MYKHLLHFLLVCLIALTGCAGGRGTLKMDSLRYPVSMSAFLLGHDNNILVKNEELKYVKDFKYETVFWSTLYSQVSLSNDKDIADEINKRIEETGGDGLINLSITSSQCPLNGLYYTGGHK